MKYEELSPELQEKVTACETAEEVFALAKSEGIELSEEDLELISGGKVSVGGHWGKSKKTPELREEEVARGKC